MCRWQQKLWLQIEDHNYSSNTGHFKREGRHRHNLKKQLAKTRSPKAGSPEPYAVNLLEPEVLNPKPNTLHPKQRFNKLTFQL